MVGAMYRGATPTPTLSSSVCVRVLWELVATGQDIVVVAATPAQVHNMTKAAPILKGDCSLLSSSHLCLLLALWSVRGDGACPQLAAAASRGADGCATLPDRRGTY